MVIARKTGRQLRLIWPKDHHCLAAFQDLFDVPESIDLYDSMSREELRTPNVISYNYMEPEKRAKKYAKIDDRTDKHIYAKTAYVLRSPLVNQDELMNALRDLIPTSDIVDVFDDYPDVSKCIGVHIRNRSPLREMDLNQKEYPKAGWTDLIRYRKAASVNAFKKKMHEILLKEPATCFYVAADTEDAKEAIREEFGMDRVFTFPDSGACDSRSTECMQRALTELYILSNTTQILGSFWSSYSEVAGLMVGQRPLYAGKDFL